MRKNVSRISIDEMSCRLQTFVNHLMKRTPPFLAFGERAVSEAGKAHITWLTRKATPQPSPSQRREEISLCMYSLTTKCSNIWTPNVQTFVQTIEETMKKLIKNLALPSSSPKGLLHRGANKRSIHPLFASKRGPPTRANRKTELGEQHFLFMFCPPSTVAANQGPIQNPAKTPAKSCRESC